MSSFVAERNLRKNRGFTVNGFINGQVIGDIAKLHLGFFRIGYNGCGAIALYNALKLCGSDTPVEECIYYCDRYALNFFGLFGTRISRFRKMFTDKGLNAVFYKGKKAVQELNRHKGTAVLLYKCKGFFSGLHIVCISIGEKTKVYNLFGNSDKTYVFSSAEEMLEKVGGKFRACLIVG